MRELAEKSRVVQRWRELESKLADLSELSEISEEDDMLRADVEKEVDELAAYLDELEFELSFTSEYDARNAIMAIHAGAGGTESQDWAEMLMRMYLRWAERRGYQTEVLDMSPGDEAGVKSAIIAVNGKYAAGYLKSEHGVHRLVRLSPFDADHARHTSFALVEVMPEAEGVRITHLPTGTVVSCQSERSQYMNKDIAMKILRARLLEMELEKREAERAKLKGRRIEAGWGNQIRSYVLHPYKMVKDHRTGFETGNPEAVLDGDLDGFITAYLRSSMGQEE
jgi:peptide chain release factor 2